MIQIEIDYISHITPPGPFVAVTVKSVDGLKSILNCPAQVDCAADRCVFPQALIDQLGLSPERYVTLVGFGGSPANYAVYRAMIELPSLKPVVVEVIGHVGESWILLGRDLLNRYKITLDGPALKLTIEEP